jgi:riboflavin kinase/FMN adenylyltransferase
MKTMKNKSIALGYFDGVHTGHQAVLKAAPNTDVFTFDSRQSGNITTDVVKHKLLKQFGANNIYSYSFESIKNLSPEEFVSGILHGELRAETICAGFNFRFGKGAQADAQELSRLCGKLGIKTIIAPPVEAVSSTLIRKLIVQGGIEAANELLGYEHFYELEVVGGNRQGRTIGFPTINQNMPESCVNPRFGVYASRAEIHGNHYKAITNIGVKPTAGEHKNITIETHIIGYGGDLYGEVIKVSLLKFIRPERKFNSFGELTQQIKEDLKHG